MLDKDDREFLILVAWLFAGHGQRERALNVLAALSEDNPRDGAIAAMYADVLLGFRRADAASKVLQMAVMPPELERAEKFLSSRAEKMKKGEL